MKTRRKFIQLSALGGAAIITNTSFAGMQEPIQTRDGVKEKKYPLVISTWDHGMLANTGAWKVLSASGTALDAVEQGVRLVESDPALTSVGYGGLPDRDGIVTLDACIMDQHGNCGAVACLQDIENPISVARKVMEKTPHVILVGEGAKAFALEQGFKEKDLLTPASLEAYKEWLKTSKYEPVINRENHDTIGMLAMDHQGNLAGSCTTSGMAFKMHGRVGDSPIIGAGLFLDNEIGAACATGVGEAVIKIAGSAIVVELMRNGRTPQEACKEAVQRIIKMNKNIDQIQVGFLAINKNGETGAYAVYEGFNYALRSKDENRMVDAAYFRKENQ